MGFCGCLTTVSSFVDEVDRLPPRTSYRYAFLSFLVAQIGCLAIFGAVTFNSVEPSANIEPAINLCGTYEDLCSNFLGYVDCPDSAR